MDNVFCDVCGFEAQVRLGGILLCEDCRDRLFNEQITIDELRKRLKWEAEMHEADMRRKYMVWDWE